MILEVEWWTGSVRRVVLMGGEDPGDVGLVGSRWRGIIES